MASLEYSPLGSHVAVVLCVLSAEGGLWKQGGVIVLGENSPQEESWASRLVKHLPAGPQIAFPQHPTSQQTGLLFIYCQMMLFITAPQLGCFELLSFVARGAKIESCQQRAHRERSLSQSA